MPVINPLRRTATNRQLWERRGASIYTADDDVPGQAMEVARFQSSEGLDAICAAHNAVVVALAPETPPIINPLDPSSWPIGSYHGPTATSCAVLMSRSKRDDLEWRIARHVVESLAAFERTVEATPSLEWATMAHINEAVSQRAFQVMKEWT